MRIAPLKTESIIARTAPGPQHPLRLFGAVPAARRLFPNKNTGFYYSISPAFFNSGRPVLRLFTYCPRRPPHPVFRLFRSSAIVPKRAGAEKKSPSPCPLMQIFFTRAPHGAKPIQRKGRPGGSALPEESILRPTVPSALSQRIAIVMFASAANSPFT